MTRRRTAPHGHCYWCKRDLLPSHHRSEVAHTRDHVIPKSMGGTKKVKCCRKCNQLKSDMHPDRWREVMRLWPKWYHRFTTHQEVIRALSRRAAEQSVTAPPHQTPQAPRH